MRKSLVVLVVGFAVAYGVTTLKTEAGLCSYRCICSVPHKCCTSGGVTTCKPDPNGPLQCTQVYDC